MAHSSKPIPAAPPGFDFRRLQLGSTYWYQRWELFEGIHTPGAVHVERNCELMQLPDDLTGMRVLDVGAWNGCMSLECERRGADEVVAIGPETPELSGFNLLVELTGSRRVRWEYKTCYQLNPLDLGTFDIVLFSGVLYHLRYPLLGVDNLRKVCRGQLFVESHVVDFQRFGPEVSSLPLWCFYRRGELANDESNWFGPTVKAIEEALESAGFSVCHSSRAPYSRAVFRAEVKPDAPEFLTLKTAEGVYYDTIAAPILGPRECWDASGADHGPSRAAAPTTRDPAKLISTASTSDPRISGVTPQLRAMYHDIIEEPFWAIVGKCLPHTMVLIERLYNIYKSMEYITRHGIEGAIVECGVAAGGSVMAAAESLAHFGSTDREIYLYDTFEGMTAPGPYDFDHTGRHQSTLDPRQLYWPGPYHFELIQKNLRLCRYPLDRFVLVKGAVQKTLPSIMPEKIAFLRLDTDFFDSTLHELTHLFPRLVSGGVITIDDYGHFQGARKATDEFFSNCPDRVLLHRIDYSARTGVKP